MKVSHSVPLARLSPPTPDPREQMKAPPLLSDAVTLTRSVCGLYEVAIMRPNHCGCSSGDRFQPHCQACLSFTGPRDEGAEVYARHTSRTDLS